MDQDALCSLLGRHLLRRKFNSITVVYFRLIGR
jgi:hypothetical protein